MNNFEVIGDDDQSRIVLIQKFNDIDQRYRADLTELNQNKNRNANLFRNLLQLEELVFQQKSETKDEEIIPRDMLHDFIKHTETINVQKLQMEYFKELADGMSNFLDRITCDYKLNPDNSLDMLILETKTLEQNLLQLNGVMGNKKKINENLKNEVHTLSNEYDGKIYDYNWITDQNNYYRDSYTNTVERCNAECQSKENELADLKNYINKLNDDIKLVKHHHYELLKEKDSLIECEVSKVFFL